MKDLLTFLSRYSRVLLYGAWFYALSSLLGDSGHETFLRPEFGWLLGLGVLTLLGFAIAEMGRLSRSKRPSLPGAMRWLVLAAPLVYLPIASDVVLDTSAFKKRWTGFEQSGATDGPALVDRAAAAVSDGLRSATLADLWRNARAYNGQRVRVDGMITRVPELTGEIGPDAGLLYRFMMTCCVADAIPVAVLLTGSIPKEWPDDTWVRADGTLALEEHNGRATIHLRIDRIVRIEPPKRPYLY